MELLTIWKKEVREIKEFFNIQDLKGYDCYEFIKDISDIVGEEKTAELLELYGGNDFYIPNLLNLKQSKIRFVGANITQSNQTLAKYFNQSKMSIMNYKKEARKIKNNS